MKGSRFGTKRGRGFSRLGLSLVLPLIVGLSACATSLYTINLKYEPTQAIRPSADLEKVKVTVATFEDLRKRPDLLAVGEVVKTDGGKIPVFPKYIRAPEAVSSGFREYLRKAGYSVTDRKPAWDLKNGSIREGEGDILIGGSIDELWVSCVDERPKKKYRASVKLNVLFADVRKKWVFYKTTTQSSASLDHVFFSEDRLQEQLNGVLDDAIEKVFEGGEAQRRIKEALKGKP